MLNCAVHTSWFYSTFRYGYISGWCFSEVDNKTWNSTGFQGSTWCPRKARENCWQSWGEYSRICWETLRSRAAHTTPSCTQLRHRFVFVLQSILVKFNTLWGEAEQMWCMNIAVCLVWHGKQLAYSVFFIMQSKRHGCCLACTIHAQSISVFCDTYCSGSVREGRK